MAPAPPPPQSQTAALFEQRTEQTLTESARIFRDAFVISYIIDYDGASALYRLGYTGDIKSARSRASNLLREQYVSCQLAQRVRTLKESDVVSRGQVMSAMWREANTARDCHARVAALAHLAKMLGLLENINVTNNVVQNNVMLVPMVEGAEWTDMAQAAQLALKARAGEIINVPAIPQA